MEIPQEKGEIIIAFIIIITALIITIMLLHDRTNEDKKELNQKDKMYKALTTLIYIIIALILIPIAIKVLFWTGVIATIKN